MTTQLSIFISSKMQELADERKLLHGLMPTLDTDLVKLRAWVFEDDAPASSVSIRQMYLNALRSSALYIGLYWNEYGEWTVDEFQRATEWGIDRHIYVKNVNTHQRDARLQQFLDRQSDVISGITPKWFTTLDELRGQVKKSIEVWLQDYLVKRPGDTSATLAELADDIPEQPTRLVGRETLLREARSLLEDHARVLLQGFGGMGKTALAAAIAAAWLDDGRGTVLWLRTGTESADTIFEALARPFEAQPTIASATGNSKLKAVRSMLGESGVTLLVLDDVWNGAALAQVIKAVPRNLGVLVTARQRYALDDILEVGRLAPNDALGLLGYHARQDYSTDQDAQELCRQVGYHAFALEVAGKTLKVDQIKPRQLLERFGSRPHDIAMPESFAEEGRSSIKELLDASINALDDQSRRVFLTYGTFFVPSATPELLARSMQHDASRVEQALLILQRRGLAEQLKSGGSAFPAFRIHDLAFSYARTIQLSQDGRREAAIRACRDFTVAHENDLEALEAEHGNVFGAAQAARETGQLNILVDIMRILIGRFLSARGHDLPFLELLDAAISATEALGDTYRETRHYLLSKRGNAHFDRGDLTGALACFQKALDLARALELKDREVILLSVIGTVRSDQNADDVDDYLNRAYELAASLQDYFLVGYVLECQGYHAQAKGDYQTTRQIFAEEVKLAERIGDYETLFAALANLGSAEHKLGDYAAALVHHQRALSIARDLDNRVYFAHALQSIAEDQHQLGAHEQAQQGFREALSIFRASGMKTKIAEIETYMKEADYPAI